MTPIRVETVPLPPPDIREIRRYARCPEGADEALDGCLRELTPGIVGRAAWRICDVTETDAGLGLGFAVTDSADLIRSLSGCDRVLLFAATVGFAPDRLIRRYAHLSPAKVLWMQAIGTERVETLCDVFCAERGAELAADGCTLRPRFSPGYGDLPLGMQRDVFASLDCERQLGVTLNDSLLMMPSKSVTALAGITRVGKEKRS